VLQVRGSVPRRLSATAHLLDGFDVFRSSKWSWQSQPFRATAVPLRSELQ
jgi:hypothetical protein